MNTVIIVAIVLYVIALIYFLLFKRGSGELVNLEEEDVDQFTEENLKIGIIERFDSILQADYTLLNLNKYETMKNERNQNKLDESLKLCSCGNVSCKLYVKDFILDTLQLRLGINEDTINATIPFDDFENLSSQDKYEILLFLYKQKYGFDALSHLISDNKLDEPIGSGNATHYDITSNDIDRVYKKHLNEIEHLTYFNKLEILTQRIYQISYGLDAVDELRDMRVDGFNCGTSGIPSTFYSYEDGTTETSDLACNAVWVLYKGKMIHFSFLGFHTPERLQRVTKLVCKYGGHGTLDADTGYIVSRSQDGCRVVSARPNFAESWMFFIRRFDTASKMTFEEMYPFDGVDKLIDVVHWVVTGCRNIAITGEQMVGKTTFVASLVQFISASFGLRVQEMEFELHLRKIYPERNIATFADTGIITAQDGIELSKKTDGTASIFGEIAQAKVAALAIQMGQVGAAQVIFTHHAKTVVDLIESFRDNMIEAAGYTNEKVVELTVARVLNFQIHLRKTTDGVRYVERVTMILPKRNEPYPERLDDAQREYFYRSTDRQVFEYFDIIRYENGKYVFKNNFSPEVIEDMERFLSSEECYQFAQLRQRIDMETSNGRVGGGVCAGA